jgi:tRNA dimethylallyltransferase
LASTLAEWWQGTVVNADSMQVYSDLAILTARPSAAEMLRAPHRLYGVWSLPDVGSAARWREAALCAIGETLAEGRLPIVVGGTGLYIGALLRGLSPIPDIPPAIRAATRARYDEQGGAVLYRELSVADPETAARLRPTDRQRLIRATEVMAATGRPLAEWQRHPPMQPSGIRFTTILLLPPRESLYRACNERFRRMVGAGAVDEVRRLLARKPAPEHPLMKAVGVPELARCLAGETDLEAATVAGQVSTRHYAKRQITWFRHQIRADVVVDAPYLDAQFLERNGGQFFAKIRQSLLTPES